MLASLRSKILIASIQDGRRSRIGKEHRRRFGTRPTNQHMHSSHLRSFGKCLLVAFWCLVFGHDARAQATVTNIVRGDIAYPGERDTFSFSVTAQKRFYFDALTNVSALRWSIAGPPGVIVTNRAFTSTDSGGGDPLLVLPEGNYSLTIEASGGATNAYAFRLIDLAEATLVSFTSSASG